MPLFRHIRVMFNEAATWIASRSGNRPGKASQQHGVEGECPDSLLDYFSAIVLNYSLSTAACRAGCGSVRGSPVFISHFSPRLAPQVGHRTIRAASFPAFIIPSCPVAGQ